jgi:hypothetical protein
VQQQHLPPLLLLLLLLLLMIQQRQQHNQLQRQQQVLPEATSSAAAAAAERGLGRPVSYSVGLLYTCWAVIRGQDHQRQTQTLAAAQTNAASCMAATAAVTA